MARGKYERQCPECGKVNWFEGSQALFCPPAEGQNSQSCKKAWNNRNLAQGGPLVPWLKAWRMSRRLKGDPIGGIVLIEVCNILDRLIAEDKAAGRPNPVAIIKQRIRGQGIGSILEPRAPVKVGPVRAKIIERKAA